MATQRVPETETPASADEAPSPPPYSQAFIQFAHKIAPSLQPAMMHGSVALYQIDQFWHALHEPVSALLAEMALLKEKLHESELAKEKSRSSANVSNPQASVAVSALWVTLVLGPIGTATSTWVAL
jgi:hypothetical protein